MNELRDVPGNPEPPSLKRLAQLNGEPPWALTVADMMESIIPLESSDLIGELVWRGIRFVRDEGQRRADLYRRQLGGAEQALRRERQRTAELETLARDLHDLAEFACGKSDGWKDAEQRMYSLGLL